MKTSELKKEIREEFKTELELNTPLNLLHEPDRERAEELCLFIDSIIDRIYEEGKREGHRGPMESLRIGFLRQWLNEDRITDPNKMVTNEELRQWLTPNEITS